MVVFLTSLTLVVFFWSVGDKNECVKRMADYLQSQGSGGQEDSDDDAEAASSGGSSTGGGGGGGGKAANKAMIQNVLDNALNYDDLLSLSGNTITKSSSTAEMRKAYLKLSLKIHPDKNGQSAESKQAFQALISAFERLSVSIKLLLCCY